MFKGLSGVARIRSNYERDILKLSLEIECALKGVKVEDLSSLAREHMPFQAFSVFMGVGFSIYILVDLLFFCR
jgi:hypothetical protein